MTKRVWGNNQASLPTAAMDAMRKSPAEMAIATMRKMDAEGTRPGLQRARRIFLFLPRRTIIGGWAWWRAAWVLEIRTRAGAWLERGTTTSQGFAEDWHENKL